MSWEYCFLYGSNPCYVVFCEKKSGQQQELVKDTVGQRQRIRSVALLGEDRWEAFGFYSDQIWFKRPKK